MFQIGTLLAQIQQCGREVLSRHRNYWDADGLLGVSPKFGSIDALTGIDSEEQSVLTKARKKILRKLRSYQSAFPAKIGLIHADLHFGNLLKLPGGAIAAIDFDDCGVGFYVYDLVVPLISLQSILRRQKRMRVFPALKSALIEGYRTHADFNSADARILEELMIARELLMLGWLHSRSENPRLRGLLRKYARETVRELKAGGR